MMSSLRLLIVFSLCIQNVVYAADDKNTYSIDFQSANGQLLANGEPFYIKGANWFGFEGKEHILQGVWPSATTIDKGLDILVKYNFNAIRLPLALDAIADNPPIIPSQTAGDSSLFNLNYLEAIDVFVAKCAEKNILVIFDNHRTDSKVPTVDEVVDVSAAKTAFTTLADRYCTSSKYWNVIGVDLKNEPHGKAR